MKRIKLLWDFRGPNAKGIADHHVIHLNEFAKKENIQDTSTGVESVSDMYHIAYMIVNETDMLPVRDALRPHRGEVA